MKYRFFASLLICCCITLPAFCDRDSDRTVCHTEYDCVRDGGGMPHNWCQSRLRSSDAWCDQDVCGGYCATYSDGEDPGGNDGYDTYNCADTSQTGYSCYNMNRNSQGIYTTLAGCSPASSNPRQYFDGLYQQSGNNSWDTTYAAYSRFCFCAEDPDKDTGLGTFYPCLECATGYHKNSNNTECVQDIQCAEDCSNTSWTIDSNDEKYEVKYNKICDTETGQCVSQNRAYRCAIGYYALTGLAEATTSRLKETATNQLQCTQCPEVSGTFTDLARTTAARGTTMEGGKTSVADCRIPAGTYYDESGKRVVTEYCVYDVQQ